jgi:Family of unknown function (DUF5993)
MRYCDGIGRSAKVPQTRAWAQIDGLRSFAAGEAPMEFTLLFLGVLIVMLAVWLGPRPLGLTLFAVVFVAAVATYLHHASDVLKLSF